MLAEIRVNCQRCNNCIVLASYVSRLPIFASCISSVSCINFYPQCFVLAVLAVLALLGILAVSVVSVLAEIAALALLPG